VLYVYTNCSPLDTVHDADYRQSQKDFNSFVDSLTEKVIEKDETIPELPHKDLVCLHSSSILKIPHMS